MRPDIILEKLEQAGYKSYYVGGCVRDTLLGRPIHDWDITTSALPEQTMVVFSHTVPTGIRHGTVTVIEGRAAAEVTTFRKDGDYHDGRHPDKVVFVPDLEEDLARRDFTINAMAMDLRGNLTDCFGGRADLQNKIIRCVGEPDRRFREDALRMLRAWRFSAQLGFAIEEQTEQAIEENAPLCRALSRERVSAETEKMLLSQRPELLGKAMQLGVLAACGVEGTFDLTALRSVPAEKSVRWAMLKRLVPALDLREFRLPGKLVTLAERAAEASRDAYSRQELKELIAFAGENVACVCVKISGQTALLADILQSGECVALKALAVSGKDFPDLYGRAAGALLHALLRHVLKHPEDNNRQTLLHLAEENLNVDGYKQITDVKT